MQFTVQLLLRAFCRSYCRIFLKIKRLFPPLVTGTVITVIGLTLIPVAVEKMGGGLATDKSFGDPKTCSSHL